MGENRDCMAAGRMVMWELYLFRLEGAEGIPMVLAIGLWWWKGRGSTSDQRAGPLNYMW